MKAPDYHLDYWLCPRCGTKNVLHLHDLDAFPGSTRFVRVDDQAMEGHCQCGVIFSLVDSPHRRKTTAPRSL